MRPKIAILASGEGTTAEAFIRACSDGRVEANVVLVICNKENAGIFKRIENLNAELKLAIETRLINSKTHPVIENELLIKGGQSTAEEQAILAELSAYGIDLVLLMGYLRRIGPELIKAYGWVPEYSSPYQARMLNTHCGPLPETKGFWGIHMQKHLLDIGSSYGGQTLHVVAEDYDEGPIIAEHRVPVEPNDTPESLFDRAQTAEKQYLPLDVEAFIRARTQFLSK